MGGEVFVAVSRGEVVGEVEVLPYEDCALGPRAYINILYVKKDWRGRGVSRRLVLKTIEWARERGFEFLDVIPERGVEEFYKKLGFKTVNTQFKFLKKLSAGRPTSVLIEAVSPMEYPKGFRHIIGVYRPGAHMVYVFQRGLQEAKVRESV